MITGLMKEKCKKAGKISMKTKKEWLEENVFVDIFGRGWNLSDVPMTYMARKDSFKKQRITEKEIDKQYKRYKNDYRR